MQGTIIGEDEQDIGTEITDNNEVIHQIELHKSNGEIYAHEQDGYADDPDKRTDEGNEHVDQASNYAQYYVAQETEYDTVPWELNPDRFETVQAALRDLSTEEIEQFFGELFAQSLSHYADDPDVDIGDVSRPYELPAERATGQAGLLYKQEVYLDTDDALEATSGPIADYHVARGQRETTRYGDNDTPDREPDAMLEIFPAPLVELEPFRDYLVYNLRCQIRDCYHRMGLEPPEQYKVLGHGQYQSTLRHRHYDMYPEYYDMTADIPGYTLEFTPELPISPDELMGMNSSRSSLFDQIKGSLFSR